jgi:hypothetical protein
MQLIDDNKMLEIAEHWLSANHKPALDAIAACETPMQAAYLAVAIVKNLKSLMLFDAGAVMERLLLEAAEDERRDTFHDLPSTPDAPWGPPAHVTD